MRLITYIFFVTLFNSLCLYGQTDTIESYIKTKYKSNNSVSNYNLACLYAKKNEKDSAFKYLSRSIDLDGKDCYALYDPDFNSLHLEHQWKLIEERINSAFFNSNKCLDTLTLSKLRDYYYIDQTIRNEFTLSNYSIEAKGKFIFLDSLNITTLENHLLNSNLPTKLSVSELGMNYFFIYLLHIPYDLKLKYEPYFMNRVEQSEFSLKQKAYFIDKLLIEQNKKQRYGTQLELIKSENRIRMKPVENLKELNRIRTEMGLESIEDYLKWNGATIE
jgi:hypothetical protein